MQPIDGLEERARSVLRSFAGVEGALIPALQALQREFGHLPADLVPVVAEIFNISRADVHGVITFYHDFRQSPAGRHVLKLCRAEACQAMGGERLARRACETLEADFGATTADGATTLEAVYCLGLCALAPAALLDGVPHGRLDEAALEALIAEARA